MRLIKIVLVAALFLWAVPASAHPHIFVRYKVAIAPGEKGFTNLHFTFKVKEMASPFLTPGDAPLLARDMSTNLMQHPFFIYLDMDGATIGQQQVRLTPGKSNGDERAFSFDLPLPDSVNSFGFSLYDPTYFVLVTQDGADSVTAKTANLSCTVQRQMVGKTVWGDLQTDYVQCGNPSAPRPVVTNSHKQMPAEFPKSSDHPSGGQDIVP